MLQSAPGWLEGSKLQVIKHVQSLTRWCLKNVFREKQATPMCLNSCNTFDAELPDSNIAMHSRKLPAGILASGMLGWLFQMTSFLLHFLLVQVEVTTAIVPTCLVSTSGFSALQKWQNLKSNSSCERKTINFGCVLRLSSLIYTLYREQRVTKQLYNFDHLQALTNSSNETPSCVYIRL